MSQRSAVVFSNNADYVLGCVCGEELWAYI